MRYMVLRHSPDMPREHWAEHLEGRWQEYEPAPIVTPSDAPWPGVTATAVAEPDGRYETRDDGAMAEVWVIRPTAAPRPERRRQVHRSDSPQAPTHRAERLGDEWVTSEGVTWRWTLDGWMREAI